MTVALIPATKDRSGQFVVSLAPEAQETGATLDEINGVHLKAFAGIGVVPVVGHDGRRVGWLLGDPIDHDAGEVLERPLTLDLADIDCAVEKTVYALAGRFVFVLALPQARRIYLDACGSCSLVYEPASGRAASSTGLLLDDDSYAARFDRELYDFLDVRGDGWFPAGLTAHRGISRLLANHYLDLADCRAHRHWPDRIQTATDPAGNVARICEIVQRSVAACAGGGRLVATLTAGSETRLLLACSRSMLQQIEFVTVAGPSSARDVHVAKHLARTFGLAHTVLAYVRGTAEEQLRYLYRSGHCVGGGNVEGHPSIRALSSCPYFVGGLGGEIGRAFFWRPADRRETALSARNLAFRFGMPLNDAVVSAIETWMAPLERFDTLEKLDLAYLELRMSAWGFAASYAHPSVPHIHPLICRESFRLMLELPPDWKRENRMITEGIRQRWPELLAVPINRYGDYRDTLRLVSRAIAQPGLVAKKLRKMFGR